MPEYVADPGSSKDATLSRSEATLAIQGLGDGEKVALTRIARLYARRTAYDHADLLQEAICRILSGERAWPRGMQPVVFLGGVIRSIAWQWRQREVWADLGTVSIVASTEAPQEWELFFKEVVDLFADDPAAQAVLLAVMAGHKGQELLSVIEPILNSEKEPTGNAASTMDVERELERTLKKIRRRLEKQRREVGPI